MSQRWSVPAIRNWYEDRPRATELSDLVTFHCDGDHAQAKRIGHLRTVAGGRPLVDPEWMHDFVPAESAPYHPDEIAVLRRYDLGRPS